MMRKIVSISLLVIFFFTESALSQSIKGRATYKTQRKMEVELDSTQMDGAMQEQIKAMLKKQFEKEYTLQFTNEESLYKEVEKLDAPQAGNSFVQVEVVGGGGGGALYKNLKEERMANQLEAFSKLFLIKDSLTKRDWKLEKETKNIGNYVCFKATSEYERNIPESVSAHIEDEQDETKEEKKEIVTVTAWYTPQIPVKHGPDLYHGLPGLILEIGDGEQSILCSKLVLNPSEALDIKEPRQGSKVTQTKFDAIMEKKMEEMQEQFHNDSRRGGENQIEIRIGG